MGWSTFRLMVIQPIGRMRMWLSPFELGWQTHEPSWIDEPKPMEECPVRRECRQGREIRPPHSPPTSLSSTGLGHDLEPVLDFFPSLRL
jgi:hypothetical protein